MISILVWEGSQGKQYTKTFFSLTWLGYLPEFVYNCRQIINSFPSFMQILSANCGTLECPSSANTI